MSIKIVKNKEPIYDIDDFDVVLLGVSTHNMLMGNFQGKMAYRFPEVKEALNSTPYADKRKLGKRITFNEKPIISLMFICSYPTNKSPYIDYEALENCLKTANAEFKGKRVITTLLGSSRYDGNGDKKKCLELIEHCTPDLDVTIYDYNIISIRTEQRRQTKYFANLKRQYADNKEKCKEIDKLQKEMLEQTYLPVEVDYVKRRKMQDEILNL